MPTVDEIKREYGGEQAKLLTALFDLAAKAREIDVSMNATTKERLGNREFDMVRATEQEVWAEGERQRIKAKYVELELELRAAIEVRLEEVERELSPKNASFRDFAAAAEASAPNLIAAMDMALGAGDEDAALLAFQAGRQRDLEEVVAHAIDVREDWSDLYVELADAANNPDLDPGDRFELFAQKAPSKQDLLGATQSDINVTGMLR